MGSVKLPRSTGNRHMHTVRQVFFFRFGVPPYPAQRAARANGTFSQNPKECLVAEDALVDHAEATKIAQADLVVTHPKHACLQSNANSTQ